MRNVTEHNRSVTSESQTESPLCHFVQQRLPDFLHRGLTAVDHQQIQAHLAQCDRCARRVQEARLLDNDLQAEADRYQPRLSRDASLRIQNQVYKRMQRSLVWQRTGQVVRLSTAVVALMLVVAGSFLFGRFWLPGLGDPVGDELATSETIATGESVTLPEAPLPQPTAVPTARPAIAEPEPVETERNGRVNAWQNWHSVTPGQSPEALAATIMDTALGRDEALLNELFVGLGAARQPTANLWLRLGSRCQQTLTSDDFLFTRRAIPLLTVTSVSIWYDQHLVGEIKMRQVNGEWFATFTRTPSVNPCLHP